MAVSKTSDSEIIDPNKKGIDHNGKAKDNSLIPHNITLGGVGVDPTPKYNEAPVVDNGKSAIPTSRSKFAPKADNPTPASADPGMKLPAAIAKVDPMGVALSLKNVYKLLSLVGSVMNSASSASQTKTVTKGFAGALKILAHEYGYSKVITVFNSALDNFGIQQIDPLYQQTVKEGLADLIKDAILYGENAIPKSVIPPIVYGSTLPPASLLLNLSAIPDLYIQQYYAVDEDPYPGYIQWLGPDGDSYYSQRIPTQYPYESADEDIQKTAEIEIAADFEPYIANKVMILTPSVINNILAAASTSVQDNGMEKNLGKNSAANLMSLLPQLMGLAGTALNLSQQLHLPNSVLDVGVVKEAQKKFAKNIAMAKLMEAKSAGAFDIPSSLSSLGNIASMAGALGALGISIPNISLPNIESLGSIGSITSALSSSGALESLGVSPSELAVTALNATSSAAGIASVLTNSGSSVVAAAATLNILNKVL